eukprot:s3644_g5.t1
MRFLEMDTSCEVQKDMVQMLSNPAVAAALQGKAAPVAAAAAVRKKVELRVREVGDAGASFRRVVLTEGTPRTGTTFSQVESRVSEKFASKRDTTGREVGLRPLVSLIRLRDNLQIGDDEDVEQLEDGDELEATFAAVTREAS